MVIIIIIFLYYISPQQQQEPEQLVSFLLCHNRQVKAVVEDDNCFFQCLSHFLYSHEDNHYEGRSLMVRFENLNQERFKVRKILEKVFKKNTQRLFFKETF